MGSRDQRVDLVFEGGGVKGIALAGAFAEIEARGYRAQCVAGTSAGAITAALVAAGYTGPEIEDVVTNDMHFPSFEDRPRHRELGALGDAIDIAHSKGIHSGVFFLAWITEKLAAKNLTTFGDLKDRKATDENRRYRLQVIASDLSDHAMLVLPRDAQRLGIDPDQLPVAEAVRMSMSIPIFFEPVLHPNPQTGGQHMIVDGGLLSNFPVWLFDCTGRRPEFPTFGLELVAPAKPASPVPDVPHPAQPPGFVEYMKSLADTATQAHDRFYLEDEDFARTIAIDTLGVRTTEFNIPPENVAALIRSGHDAADRFLATWDFGDYVEKYRSGRKPTEPVAAPSPA